MCKQKESTAEHDSKAALQHVRILMIGHSLRNVFSLSFARDAQNCSHKERHLDHAYACPYTPVRVEII